MNEEAVRSAFAAHGPWVSRFVVDGVAYGGSFDAMHDPRLDLFFATFPTVRTVLELGSLEGSHTISLARNSRVTRVLGLEGRKANLERARLAATLLRARNVEFAEANLQTEDLGRWGKFDAIYCCGLLYHLPEPWKLVRQFAGVSPRLFLSTHYAAETEPNVAVGEYRGRIQVEGGIDEPLSGLSTTSFWPTIGSLVDMLTTAGFPSLHVLGNDPTQPNGPAIAIAASIDPADRYMTHTPTEPQTLT